MCALTRAAIFVAMLLSTAAVIKAQPSQRDAKDAKEPTGFIAGHVTNDGRGVPAIAVALMPAEMFGPQYKPITKAVTDETGHYKMTGVPAGRYGVMPLAPAFVVSGLVGSGPRAGKPVNLQAGENIEDIDFTLTRGGVIAGRITDADGKPVIGQYVRLEAIDARGQRLPLYSYNPYDHETDDRGMYRIYGLSVGRYLVSIGESKDSDRPMMRSAGGYYTQTFYLNTTDGAQAKPIEVTPGSEATDINITLGRLSKAYKASGRVVDVETGQPMPDVICAYGSVTPDGRSLMGSGGATRSNARGEFQLEGIMPGRYVAYVGSTGQPSASYSEGTPFEIIDGDLNGLEVKVHRGATINGVVAIEGTTDRAALATLSKLSIGASVEAPGLNVSNSARSTINADGSFYLTGLRPGKARLFLANFPPLKGFSLLRVEHNGVEQRGGIEVGPGEQITGVRVVLSYGTSVVRGEVQVQNGTLPENARMGVRVRRTDSAALTFAAGADVDARGRFVIEGLSGGEYELMLQVYVPRGHSAGWGMPPIKKVVNVPDRAETSVTFVLDLSAGNKQEGAP